LLEPCRITEIGCWASAVETSSTHWRSRTPKSSSTSLFPRRGLKTTGAVMSASSMKSCGRDICRIIRLRRPPNITSTGRR
jgi:hypothetical protein